MKLRQTPKMLMTTIAVGAFLALTLGCATTLAPPTPDSAFADALGEPPVAETPCCADGGGGIAPVEPTVNPARGEQVFLGDFGATPCSSCHLLSSEELVGPGLSGLYARAATRVAGQDAETYVINSIRNPNDFVVDGYGMISSMPVFAETTLDDRDLRDLLAYLETL